PSPPPLPTLSLHDALPICAQVAVPGLSTYGVTGKPGDAKGPNDRAQLWEPRAYVRAVPRLFEHLRKQVGDEVELLHDMHERVPRSEEHTSELQSPYDLVCR